MLAFGVIGWLMEEHGIPVAPLVLGLVLGELLEQSFMTDDQGRRQPSWPSSPAPSPACWAR
jgi:hypothetical protein